MVRADASEVASSSLGGGEKAGEKARGARWLKGNQDRATKGIVNCRTFTRVGQLGRRIEMLCRPYLPMDCASSRTMEARVRLWLFAEGSIARRCSLQQAHGVTRYRICNQGDLAGFAKSGDLAVRCGGRPRAELLRKSVIRQ